MVERYLTEGKQNPICLLIFGRPEFPFVGILKALNYTLKHLTRLTAFSDY